MFVFGSQAILGEHPDAPEALLVSEEVDLTPKNRPDLTDRVDAILGQDSIFHRTHGFYVHGVPIHEAATLPPGWEGRAVRVKNPNTRHLTGWCLEGHDLAASKLAAFRDKDREFVQALLVEGLVDNAILSRRVAALSLERTRSEMLLNWLRAAHGGH